MTLDLAASLPIGDWQFWVATALAIFCGWFVFKNLFPKGMLPFSKRRGTRASLTISAKPSANEGKDRDSSGRA